MQEKACPTSLTLPLNQYKDLCLSMGTPLNKGSFKEQYSSTKTSYRSVPPHRQPWSQTTSHSSLPIWISSYHHNQVPHIQSTLGHHLPHTKKTKRIMVPTNHDHPRQRKDHNQESFQATNGSKTCRGWNPWSTTAYQGWQVGKSLPPSSVMTLLRTIWKSYSLVGATAPTTPD